MFTFTRLDTGERPEIGISFKRYPGPTYALTLGLWFWVLELEWYEPKPLRDSGPEDNRAVLGWFFRGADRRRRGRAYRDAFNQPVPSFSTLSATEIRERNRKAVESGRFKPWGSIGKLDQRFEP